MTRPWRTALRLSMLATDAGFVLYWLVVAAGVLPESWLYADAHDPIVVAWNWSFLPLDLAISATGFASLALERRRDPRWAPLAWLSLGLMAASGLNAVSFFALRGEYDPAWWIPNLWLVVAPAVFGGRWLATEGR